MTAAHAKKTKGREILHKSQGKAVRHVEKPNKDIYNKADESLRKMVHNTGIPRVKVGIN